MAKLFDDEINQELDELFEHRGKANPKRLKEREEAHKRAVARHEHYMKTLEEQERKRKEKEKERQKKEREELAEENAKELQKKKQQDKKQQEARKAEAAKRQQEKEERQQQQQEVKDKHDSAKSEGKHRFWSDDQKQQLKDNSSKRDEDIDKIFDKIQTNNDVEGKVKQYIQDAADEVKGIISKASEEAEDFDIDSSLDDTFNTYAEKLSKDKDIVNDSYWDSDEFKKEAEENDGLYDDLDTDVTKVDKKKAELDKKIKALKEKHSDEIEKAKTSAERERLYKSHKKELQKLEMKKKKLDVSSREEYRELKDERRAKRTEKFEATPAVRWFKYHWFKISEPFIKFGESYNKLCELADYK